MTRDQFLACYRDAEVAFHRHWSAQVGQPGYNKRAWQTLHNELGAVWRDCAEAFGIHRTEPLA